ncbi:putative efflux pump antibiotic resistance protein [Aspergillus steynii IBT 23096]|uniref:Putative efflux pump antibiotic resistance protein n=1 Tax=Aspergillus steynii IBT 23096 TaxID=1392250 RepID=A0A2I2G6W6_9EURO|nr:putative efflux pump antibiotic resistance protein [Aspergillus steynii IBT 23096]PLB48605.1 putative efflux pump antibiotic resistance protein [Aspergillus steynii IBT 23096]
MFCNFLSLFLVALDRTIVATAIPRITDEFNSLGDIGWYGSAYMLTGAASQSLFGRIYKIYHTKWVFLTSVVVFEVGSAICGAAPSSNALIAGRAIAGFASAAIFSGCMLVVIGMVPLHKRPMFQGMFAAVFGIASVMGPLIGGGFTGGVTWRWCFYLNLPIGAVSLVLMALVWHPSTPKHEPAPILRHAQRLDPFGTLFFLPCITCLLLALQWGGSTYAWNDGRIIGLVVVFGVLAVGFAVIQVLMPETATIPVRVIKRISVFCAALFTFFASSAMTMILYYLPIWFQTVKQASPVKSGVYTLPLVLSLVIASFLSGFVTQKTGYYVPVMYICPCLLSIGLGLMSTLDVDTGSSHWIGYQFLCGFGLGLGMQSSGLAVQTILPSSDISIGIAFIFLCQQLGGCIFATVGQNILSNHLVSKLSGIPGVDPNQIVHEGATNLASVVSSDHMFVVKQALNSAATRIFLAALGLALAALLSSLGMEWKSIKESGAQDEAVPTGATNSQVPQTQTGKSPG